MTTMTETETTGATASSVAAANDNAATSAHVASAEYDGATSPLSTPTPPSSRRGRRHHHHHHRHRRRQHPAQPRTRGKNESSTRHVHFDCYSGAAGDMLLASLIDCHPNPQALLSRIGRDIAKGMPDVADEFQIGMERVWRGKMGGIAAVKVHVQSSWGHAAAPTPSGGRQRQRQCDASAGGKEGRGRGGDDGDGCDGDDEVAAVAASETAKEEPHQHDHAHEHDREHDHSHGHNHDHGHNHSRADEGVVADEQKKAVESPKVATSEAKGGTEVADADTARDETTKPTTMPNDDAELEAKSIKGDESIAERGGDEQNRGDAFDQDHGRSQNRNHSHPHGHSHSHYHGHSHSHSHGHSHSHSHSHGHSHSHSHSHSQSNSHNDNDNNNNNNNGPLRSLPVIRRLLLQSNPDCIPPVVRDLAICTFTELALAESRTHGSESINDVYFHEVGAIDSIVDTIGTLLTLYYLGVDLGGVDEAKEGDDDDNVDEDDEEKKDKEENDYDNDNDIDNNGTPIKLNLEKRKKYKREKTGTNKQKYGCKITCDGSKSKISCTPLPWGEGTVWTAHGQLPSPAFATARLMIGMRTCPGPGMYGKGGNSVNGGGGGGGGNGSTRRKDDEVTGELVTPTAAALLRVLTGVAASSSSSSFVLATREEMTGKDDDAENDRIKVLAGTKTTSRVGRPPYGFVPIAVGVGAGTKDFVRWPNVVRAVLGEVSGDVQNEEEEEAGGERKGKGKETGGGAKATPLTTTMSEMSTSNSRTSSRSVVFVGRSPPDASASTSARTSKRPPREGGEEEETTTSSSSTLMISSTPTNQTRTIKNTSTMWKTDRLAHLETNIDDMTPELLAHVVDLLLRNGAVDAWTHPIAMKKGRSAQALHCLCLEEDNDENDDEGNNEQEEDGTAKKGKEMKESRSTVDRLLELMFRQTTTLGIRIERNVERAALRRIFVDVCIPRSFDGRRGRGWGRMVDLEESESGLEMESLFVRVKIGILGNGHDDDEEDGREEEEEKEIISIKAEFDDCRNVAKRLGVPIADVAEYASRIAGEKVGLYKE